MKHQQQDIFMRKRCISGNSIDKTSRGIKLLLEGSLQSHCNTLIGYSRIPNKYDHFHHKTYASVNYRRERVSTLSKFANFNMLEYFLNYRKPNYNQYENVHLPRTPIPRRVIKY